MENKKQFSEMLEAVDSGAVGCTRFYAAGERQRYGTHPEQNFLIP